MVDLSVIQSGLKNGDVITQRIINVSEANNLIELGDTPSSYDNGKFLQSTVSGTVWTTISGGVGGGITWHDNTYHTETYATETYVDGEISTHTHTESDVTDLDKYTQAEVDAKIALVTVSGLEGYRAGEEGVVSVGAGVSTINVTFDTAQADSNYTPTFSLQNTVDANPSEYSATVTAKSTTGFSVSLSGPTDTANYKLAYSVGTDFTGTVMVSDDTSPELGGDLSLNGYSINYGSILTTNGTYQGEVITVVVDDANTVFGNVLAQGADFHFDRADADNSSLTPVFLMALQTGAGTKKALIKGQVCNTSWNWSAGKVYMSKTTGAMTQTKPATTGDIVQVVGYALSADTIFFDPVTLEIEVA
jgi:hypothetical protein